MGAVVVGIENPTQNDASAVYAPTCGRMCGVQSVSSKLAAQRTAKDTDKAAAYRGATL
jgi:hypothetical protein